MLRDVPCQISHCWVYPVAPFPRNGKIWPFYWQNMVFTCSLILVLPESQSMCPGMLHAKFHIAGFILKLPFIEMALYGKTLFSHGLSNWFFLNFNQCAQGCYMPNFTLLWVYPVDPFPKNNQNMAFMAKTWSL